jgi:signal transduction histidine kinase
VVDAEPVALSDATATAVYFAVSEALANVAKHAGASRVEVRLWAEAGSGLVHCRVRDDGTGTAVVVPGHGLAGLADRLAGVDGTLEVGPGDGGGTSLLITVPT